jgi:hypothetical protein
MNPYVVDQIQQLLSELRADIQSSLSKLHEIQQQMLPALVHAPP